MKELSRENLQDIEIIFSLARKEKYNSKQELSFMLQLEDKLLKFLDEHLEETKEEIIEDK